MSCHSAGKIRIESLGKGLSGKHEKKCIYLDCFSGISGDMFLGALVDAGLPLEPFKDILSSLPVEGYSLQVDRVCLYGITGTRLEVKVGKKQPLRHLAQILDFINSSGLPIEVKGVVSQIFHRLARIEAGIHGSSVDEVHFHEIGAVDSIVDITGVILALHMLHIEEVAASPLPLGRGFINIAHGTIPLPAPATMALLAESGAPVYGVDIEGETVTPTGAVLVTSLAGRYGKIPDFNVESVGYGAGKKDFGIPNFLRVFLGTVKEKALSYEEVVNVIEVNLDDLSPEISGYAMERLMTEGALDVYFTPIQMKKNRPALKMTVLAPVDKTGPLTEVIFRETSTLGSRIFCARKIMLPRRVEEIITPWGPVRVKVVPGPEGEGPRQVAPEYDDCSAIARREGVPLKEVFRQVERLSAYLRQD